MSKWCALAFCGIWIGVGIVAIFAPNAIVGVVHYAFYATVAVGITEYVANR